MKIEIISICEEEIEINRDWIEVDIKMEKKKETQ